MGSRSSRCGSVVAGVGVDLCAGVFVGRVGCVCETVLVVMVTC